MPKKTEQKDEATVALEKQAKEAKKFTDSKKKSITYWLKKLNYVMSNEVDINSILVDQVKADGLEKLLSGCVSELNQKYC